MLAGQNPNYSRCLDKVRLTCSQQHDDTTEDNKHLRLSLVLVIAGQDPNRSRCLDNVRLTWAEPEFTHDVTAEPDSMLEHVDNLTEVARQVTNTSGTGSQWLRIMMMMMLMRMVIVVTLFMRMTVA